MKRELADQLELIELGEAEGDKAGEYWTPERLRAARPMPLPELPPATLGGPKGPGQQNR